MTIASGGGFDFPTKGLKRKTGFIRSSDGMIIEEAKAYLEGGTCLCITQSDHAEIHKGYMYAASLLGEGVANDGALDMLIVTGANDAHIALAVAGGGDFYLSIFEGTTTSNDGAAVTAYNKARGVSTATTATVTSGPTITDSGTRIEYRYFPGGTGGNSAGAPGATRQEWIFKTGTKYMVRLLNKSGQAKTCNTYAEWYDDTPITARDQV